MRGAMVLAAASPSEFALALALLSGHILECSLKAFLSKAGLTERDLKKVGHNLSKLWELSVTKGLPISTAAGLDRDFKRIAQLRVHSSIPDGAPRLGSPQRSTNDIGTPESN